MTESPTKILIRLPNWLGDLIMSLAFIEAVKTAFPKALLYVVVKKELSNLLENDPRIEQVIPFSKAEYKGLGGAYQFGKTLRSYQFDLFFCLPNSFSSALIGFFSKAKKRIGYQAEFRQFLMTNTYPAQAKTHRVDNYLGLLRNYLEKEVERPTTKLQADKLAQAPFKAGLNIWLNINSEANSRRMPIPLAKRITELLMKEKQDFNLILSGSPKEVGYVDQLVKELPQTLSVYNLTGKTSLKELISHLSYADYLISTDSGLAHVANALGVPTVVLFGAGDENQTAPYNVEKLEVVRKQGLDCAPCLSNDCKLKDLRCLNELSPASVIEALKRLDKKNQTANLT